MTIDHPMEWLFDGVGGAALLALIGFAYHRLRSRRDVQPAQSIVLESLDVAAGDKAVVVGNRSSVQTSPVVYGSHNTFNIAHHTQDARAEEAKEEASKNEEKKDKEFSLGDVLGTLLGFAAMLGFVGGMLWAISHQSTVRGALEGNPAASTIAFQYGTGISVADGALGDQVTSCSDAGVNCLGEDTISGKTVPIPELPNGNWSRIAVFVTYTEGGDSGRVLVSTSSNNVELNYAGHRDGNVKRQIEFRTDDIRAISETQKGYWYPVDIVYRETGIQFPITVTVEEDHRRSHSATAMFAIARKQSVPSNNPRTLRPSHAFAAPPDSRQITIAERVTAIIARRLYVSSEKVKPEDDFEIDLGASPGEVTLIFYDLEEEYGISMPKADALKIRTVGGAIHYIEARVGGKSTGS